MGEWIQIISQNESIIEKYYEKEAIFRDQKSLEELLKPLKLISQIPFTLSLEE